MRWMIVLASLLVELLFLNGVGMAEGEWQMTGELGAPRGIHTSTLLPSGKILVVGGAINEAEFLSSAEIYDPDTGIWTDTRDLRKPRQSHTSTLLPSGKVLVVGGWNGSNLLSSAEIYDPAAETWTATRNLTTPRDQHTSTLLPSGKVLVAGGRGGNGEILSSAEIYDPDTRTWTDAGSLTTPRRSHTSTLLSSGKVLVVGGLGDSSSLSSTEIYDPNIGTWAAAADLATPRNVHTSTLLPSGKVLVVGGWGDSSSLSSTEIYDPDTGTWAAAADLATSRRSHTSALLPSGKVLVAGGGGNGGTLSSAEIFDPNTEAWAAAADLSIPRWFHTSTLLPSGRILVVAGATGVDVLSSAEIYDSSVCIWADAEDLSIPRWAHTSTLLPSGEVLVVGGYNGDFLSSTEIYDPSAETWTHAQGLATPRESHTSTLLLSGKVLIVGGYNGDLLSSTEIYDPSAGTWANAQGLATPRVSHTSTLLPSGRVLVVGGFSEDHASGPSTSVEIYDPSAGTWAAVADLAMPRALHTATLLPSGKVLVVGGYDFSDLRGAEIYDPNEDTWTDAGNPLAPRFSHTSTLLSSGKVLVAGGSTQVRAEIYDPDAGTWKWIVDLAARRSSHSATFLPSGQVLVVAGRNSNDDVVSSAEIYSPSTGLWTDAGILATPRSSHTSTLLPSGKVLVVGGAGSNSSLSDVEFYEGSSPPESRKPIIQVTSENFRYGEAFAITGLFRGDSEASGSNTWGSAVNYPFIHLRSLEGTEHHRLIPDPQSNFWDAPKTLTVSNLPNTIHPGFHLLSVSVAGVSSEPVPVDIECSLAITTQPIDQVVVPTQTVTFAVESQGGRLYQWQRNGVDIREATGSTYTTPPVTFDDDGAEYRVLVDGGCTREFSETAELIVTDFTPPEVEVTRPSGGEYWLLTEPEADVSNSEIVAWTMSASTRICTIDVELIYSNDFGASWSDPITLKTFGDTESCPPPGQLVTHFNYDLPTSPPSGTQGSFYKIRVRITDRGGNSISAESTNPFFMIRHDADIRTLILTNSSRIDTTPDLNFRLQTLADHPTVSGFIVDLAGVTAINDLYDAWDSGGATANDVLFAEGGIHDHIVSLLEIYPQTEYLIVVGGDDIIPLTRLVDRTFRLPESEYAGVLPPSTVRQALAANKYLSDDPLATRHSLRPSQLDSSIHLADLSIGRLVETPEEISAAIDAYVGQAGVLDLSLREPKALVTGYDFLQDSARRIESHWRTIYNPEDVDGQLISDDWNVATIQERRELLADALAQAPGFMSLNGHATHFEEGVPGEDRFDIRGLHATDIAALDLTGCIVYAIGCHGGLPVPGEDDLPQSFLGAGAAVYLAGSGYGWGLLEGIGLAERLAVILTEELVTSAGQSIGDAIRRGKRRYYHESPRWDAYDIKTLHQPILYGFPTYSLQTDTVPPSPLKVRVTRNKSSSPLPPHVVSLEIHFDFTAEGVYRKYDAGGFPTADCPPEGCYYQLNGLATGESDLPIEPYFRYDSSLAGTSQHGILWLGGPYLEEDGWTPIFGRIASNDGEDIGQSPTPEKIFLPPTGPRPTDPTDNEDLCPAQDDDVNSFVVTTGELLQTEGDGPGEYSIHRLAQEVDLEVFYFNNPDDQGQNCDREGPVFSPGGETHELLGTTLHWSVDVQDDSGVWRVLAIWDDEQTDHWRPVELTYDDAEERWVGSLPAAGRERVTYVLQAVDKRGNVAWKEVDSELPPSGVPLGLVEIIEVVIGEGDADLQATLVAPSEVNAGDRFTAMLTAFNSGPDQANQLTATLTLPPGMSYVFGGSDSWACSEGGPGVVCARDVLEVGETTDIFILLDAPGDFGGSSLLSACVNAAEGDTSELNHCDEASILVLEDHMTDLAIDKEDGGIPAVPGQPIAYSITVSNLGPNPATDAVVTDIFPPELLDVAWTCTATVGSSCTPSGNGDIVDLVDIASGGTLVYIADAVVDENASGPVVNTATVEASDAMEDIDLFNNSDQTVTEPIADFFTGGFETGVDGNWRTITLERAFTDPIVIAKPASHNDADPGVVRLRNVTPTSFEIRFQEWDYLDGTHASETVSYLVIERGDWLLADGTKIEAGSIDTANSRPGGSPFVPVAFNTPFVNPPVVLSVVGTFNGPDAVATRHSNVVTSGFEVILQEQESKGGHIPERIYWIAWQSGQGAGEGSVPAFEVGFLPEVTQSFSPLPFATAWVDPPCFLADQQTFNVPDSANLRHRNLTSTGVEIQVDEEQSLDGETDHSGETVGYLAFACERPWSGLEVGRLTVSHAWQTVQLREPFLSPVVVAKPASYHGSDPTVVRLRNVTPTSFEIRLQEWNYLNGTHIGETVSYLVAERGSWALPGGGEVEAGTVEISASLPGNEPFVPVPFSVPFAQTPLVFSVVGSFNGPDTVATRQRAVTAEGFELILQEQESKGGHIPETVHWIAWTPGVSSTADPIPYQARSWAGVTDAFTPVAFESSMSGEVCLLSDLQTVHEGDSANLRYRHLTANGFEIQVDEEQSLDSETSHTGETVGYLAFECP